MVDGLPTTSEGRDLRAALSVLDGRRKRMLGTDAQLGSKEFIIAAMLSFEPVKK